MSDNWLQRWQNGRIGWHQADGNPSLRKYWRTGSQRVLVPLCGKSVDLRWIAEQGNEVIGIELSRLAVEAFFAEQHLAFEIHEGELPHYRAKDIAISIFCGDYFQLKSIRCDAHYDRGALIAMPRELRAAYAEHTDSLLTGDATQLVITVEYDDAIVDGPPYSVADEEVQHYWPHLDLIDSYDDIDDAPPKFVDAGLDRMFEKVWQSP